MEDVIEARFRATPVPRHTSPVEPSAVPELSRTAQVRTCPPMGAIGEFGQIRKDAIPGIIRSIPMVKSADSVTDREAKSQSYGDFVIVPVQPVTFSAMSYKSSRSMDLAQHEDSPR